VVFFFACFPHFHASPPHAAHNFFMRMLHFLLPQAARNGAYA